ncbi:MAG TPA: PilN domain-containing protein [Rhodocyclaceae bacterium]|nr:PilN domain-containing protein [Zoogloeaceae bacterium]HRD33661.1 PilN domain-containing protein [Rhodocyclaceae bacterium]
MIRINLLPHREEKRRERKREFFVISALVVVLGAAIAYLVHTLIVSAVDAQDARNNIFKTEIKNLDTEIAEIKNLREQIDALLERKQVIESLQHNRSQSVHLMNELLRSVPDGVYLKSIKQTGPLITLAGYAQSNSRVSHLMRNLDQSPFLERPGLIEVKSASLDNRRLSEFSLNISITQASAEDATEAVR